MVYRHLIPYLFVCLLEHENVKNKTNKKHASFFVITKLTSFFTYGLLKIYIISVWVVGI